MGSRCTVVSEAQWESCAPLMPDFKSKAKSPFKDHLRMTVGTVPVHGRDPMAGIYPSFQNLANPQMTKAGPCQIGR